MFRSVNRLLIVVLLVGSVPIAANSSPAAFQFNSQCERAINSGEFKSGLAGLKEGGRSIVNMGQYLTDDQQAAATLLVWQLDSALREAMKLDSLSMLRPMLSPSKRSDADRLLSIHLEGAVSLLGVVARGMDTAILQFKNEGLREEIRGVRRSIQKLLSATQLCSK